jgi:hypothetical protein
MPRDALKATQEQVRQQIAEVREGSQRLYDANFLGRLWVADYTATVDHLIDYLEDVLERMEPVTP